MHLSSCNKNTLLLYLFYQLVIHIITQCRKYTEQWLLSGAEGPLYTYFSHRQNSVTCCRFKSPHFLADYQLGGAVSSYKVISSLCCTVTSVSEVKNFLMSNPSNTLSLSLPVLNQPEKTFCFYRAHVIGSGLLV